MLKNKKKVRRTKKNLIKQDSRYAQRPKLPMSPYFLFLQEMRATNNGNGALNSMLPNRQFAQKMGQKWREMSEQQKKPYVMVYVKNKKIYDDEMHQYYLKYPDLKPEGKKYDKPVYGVNDPKYKLTENEEEEMETNLIDGLPSEQEDNSADSKDKKNEDKEENNNEEYEEEWNQQSDSINEQKVNGVNASQQFREVVEID